MGSSILFCTSALYASDHDSEGLAMRFSVRFAPQRLRISTPMSLECIAASMPRRGMLTVHLAMSPMVLAVAEVHSDWQPSQDRAQPEMRAEMLARHASTSLPTSGASRSREKAISHPRRSGRIRYRNSVTPERCVREALGEQVACAPVSEMQ